MNPQPIFVAEPKTRRSPFLAAVLSLLLPGAGQIYCSQDNKGIFLVGFFLLGHWATNGISSLLLCPLLSLDAAMLAQKWNQGSTLARWEFFPAIKFLNTLSPRVIPLAIVILLATITVIRILLYASDYNLTQ